MNATNKNARVDLTTAGGYSVPAVFAFELKNGTNSIDLDDMKRAGLIYPKTAQTQTVALATNPPCRLFINKFWTIEP